MAQFQDDFNDGNDAGWVHYDLNAFLGSVGVPGTFADYTFPTDGQGGKAYRIRAYAPPPPEVLGDNIGPARAFSYQNPSYSRVLAKVDVLDWNTSPDPVFGILFRAQDIGIGTTHGYVFNFNAADLDLQMNRVEGEAEAGTIAETHAPLTPSTQNYRMVLSTYGPNLLGQLFQLPDVENPIASVVAIDDTTKDGKVGLFNFDGSTKQVPPGQSLVMADTTFDNFAVEAPAVGSLKAVAVTLVPTPAAVVRSATPVISYAVLDRESTVALGSFQLMLDGVEVPAESLKVADSVAMAGNPMPFAGATLSYALAAPIATGTHTVVASFADSTGTRLTNTWKFSTESLGGPAGVGGELGFNVRVVQAVQQDAGLGNSLARAEAQLAPDSVIPESYDTNVTASVINFSQNAINPDGTDGTFTGDAPIPGQTPDGGTDNWALTATCWLDLPTGLVTLGVQSDDGYRITCDALPGANKVIAEHDGGPANETAEIYVAAAGLYPFTLLWYENTGGAHVEWFSVKAGGERVLLNAPGGIKAYRTLASSAAPTLKTATQITGPYITDSSATVDGSLKRITTPLDGSTRFYQLSSPGTSSIKTINLQGSTVVITYE